MPESYIFWPVPATEPRCRRSVHPAQTESAAGAGTSRIRPCLCCGQRLRSRCPRPRAAFGFNRSPLQQGLQGRPQQQRPAGGSDPAVMSILSPKAPRCPPLGALLGVTPSARRGFITARCSRGTRCQGCGRMGAGMCHLPGVALNSSSLIMPR